MSLTGVNEEPGWFPRLPMFPTHTCSLTFYKAATDDSQTVTCCSVTGSAFCFEYVWNDGKSLFVPPPRKRNAYPFAVHVRFGISRSSLRERFQAGEFCKSGEDAFYKGDARTLKQESVPIQNKRSCDNVFMCFLYGCATEKRDFAASLFSRNFFFKHLFHCPQNLLHLELCP